MGLTDLLLLKTSKHTKDIGALQKGADFIKAYALGFDVNVRIGITVVVLCPNAERLIGCHRPLEARRSISRLF